MHQLGSHMIEGPRGDLWIFLTSIPSQIVEWMPNKRNRQRTVGCLVGLVRNPDSHIKGQFLTMLEAINISQGCGSLMVLVQINGSQEMGSLNLSLALRSMPGRYPRSHMRISSIVIYCFEQIAIQFENYCHQNFYKFCTNSSRYISNCNWSILRRLIT